MLPADVNWGLLRGAGEGRPTPSRTSYMAKDTDDPFKWETLFRSKELRYLDAHARLGNILIPERVIQMLKLSATALLSLTLLAGCLQSPLATSSEAQRMSLKSLCWRYVNTPPSNNFHGHAKAELQKRNVKLSSCFAIANS